MVIGHLGCRREQSIIIVLKTTLDGPVEANWLFQKGNLDDFLKVFKQILCIDVLDWIFLRCLLNRFGRREVGIPNLLNGRLLPILKVFPNNFV